MCEVLDGCDEPGQSCKCWHVFGVKLWTNVYRASETCMVMDSENVRRMMSVSRCLTCLGPWPSDVPWTVPCALWVLSNTRRFHRNDRHLTRAFPCPTLSLRPEILRNWRTGHNTALWIRYGRLAFYGGMVLHDTTVVEATADRDHRHHDPCDVHPRRLLLARDVS